MAAHIEAKKPFWAFGAPVVGDTPKKNLILLVAAAVLVVALAVLSSNSWHRLQADRHYGRAIDLHESNKVPEAVKAYKHVLSIDPNHVDANIGLGMLEARKHPLRAIARYKKAIAVDPENPDAYASLAYAYFGLPGRSTEAVDQMKKAAALAPNNYQHHLALGIFMSKTGRTDEAIAELETVVRLTPWVKTSHKKLVELYTRKGDSKKARLHRMMSPEKTR